MPTTPVYALRYPAPADPADVPTDMGELATDVENKLLTASSTYSTTPPATPVDGQLWAYPADTTNGVIWLFRYRTAATTYKWEYVGGSPLTSAVSTLETTTTTGSYVNLATVGPSVTVPRAGFYLTTGSAVITDSTTQSNAGIGVGIGDFSTQDVEAPANIAFAGAASAVSVTYRSSSALTASQEIRMKYRHLAAGQLGVFQRYLHVWPIRVS
jgi:hypothetical protein